MNKRLHRLIIVMTAVMIVFACGVFTFGTSQPYVNGKFQLTTSEIQGIYKNNLEIAYTEVNEDHNVMVGKDLSKVITMNSSNVTVSCYGEKSTLYFYKNGAAASGSQIPDKICLESYGSTDVSWSAEIARRALITTFCSTSTYSDFEDAGNNFWELNVTHKDSITVVMGEVNLILISEPYKEWQPKESIVINSMVTGTAYNCIKCGNKVYSNANGLFEINLDTKSVERVYAGPGTSYPHVSKVIIDGSYIYFRSDDQATILGKLIKYNTETKEAETLASDIFTEGNTFVIEEGNLYYERCVENEDGYDMDIVKVNLNTGVKSTVDNVTINVKEENSNVEGYCVKNTYKKITNIDEEDEILESIWTLSTPNGNEIPINRTVGFGLCSYDDDLVGEYHSFVDNQFTANTKTLIDRYKYYCYAIENFNSIYDEDYEYIGMSFDTSKRGTCRVCYDEGDEENEDSIILTLLKDGKTAKNSEIPDEIKLTYFVSDGAPVLEYLARDAFVYMMCPDVSYEELVGINAIDESVALDGVNFGYTTIRQDEYGEYGQLVLKAEANNSNPMVTLSQDSYEYDGNEKTPDVTVKFDSTILKEGTDYTVLYSNNVDLGVAKVIITLKGNYNGTIVRYYTIVCEHKHAQCVQSTKATFDKSGNITYYECPDCGCYFKDADCENEIAEGKWIIPQAKASLSKTAYTYTGKTITPAVSVPGLTKNTDYTYRYSSGLKNVGTYYATVTLRGDKYSGSKKLYFTVNPKGTTNKTPKAAKKAFTAKWSKQSGKMAKSRITGYQLQYSTSSKFSSKKTVTIKGYSKTSKKISKLKSKTRYYTRVRTYMKIGSKTYYSGWSATKSVKTK